MRMAKILRKGRGLSVQDVATATGLDRTALSRFERGERGMRTDAVLVLARYLGVEPELLLSTAPEVPA